MRHISALFMLLISFQNGYAVQWNEIESPTESPDYIGWNNE
jgi:hypothetical protein